MKPFLVCMLIAALTGCSSPTDVPDIDALENGELVDGLRLSIAESAYSHGDEATVYLINNSAASVGYNTCGAAREIWTGAAWQRIESFRVCTAALYPLATGQRIQFVEPITEEWQPGRYRIVLRVYRETRNDDVTLATHPFDVTE